MTDKAVQFVLAQVAAQLVKAYKATIAEYQAILPLDLGIDANAPETYEDLVQNARQGMLYVTTAHSDTAIYGVAGNVTFRTFHDYGHILHARKFTTEDEIALAQLQWINLRNHIPSEWVELAKVVYFADTVEQSRFEQQTGRFPVNQKAFVSGYLEDALDGLFPASF